MEKIKAKIKLSLKYSKEQQGDWYFVKERMLPFVPFVGMSYEVLDDWLMYGHVTEVELNLDDSISVYVEVIDSTCITDEDKELKDEYEVQFTKEGWDDEQ